MADTPPPANEVDMDGDGIVRIRYEFRELVKLEQSLLNDQNNPTASSVEQVRIQIFDF